MKKYLILLLLTILLSSCGRKIMVTGKAFTEKGGSVMVILNDTVRKRNASNKPLPQNWSKIFSNKKYVVETADGNFSIKAKKTDSLHFYSYEYKTQAYLVKDLLERKEISLNLEVIPCIERTKCNDTLPKLYVIVAEKIQVKRVEHVNYCNSIPLDSKYTARYKVLENVYGNFSTDTIEFTAYDHYGWPGFEKNNHVLLYIIQYCDELIQLKYQFSNLYKTTEGKWAAPYYPDQKGYLEKSEDVKPTPIQFEVPIEFTISRSSKKNINRLFPKPYYVISGNKAMAAYGYYAEDIFKLEKNMLKNYGFFKDE